MLTNPRDAFRGQSRSSNIVSFHMLGILSSCAIVTLTLRRAVFLIFDVKKCHDLEIRVSGNSGHGKWYYLIDCILVFYRNIVPKMHRCWDIRLQKCRDLVNWVTGPSRSLEMSPCDRSYTIFCWRSIVIMALSRVVSEIFKSKNVVTLKSGSKVTQGRWEWYHFDRLCIISC